jgi:hypothetical protein
MLYENFLVLLNTAKTPDQRDAYFFALGLFPDPA